MRDRGLSGRPEAEISRGCGDMGPALDGAREGVGVEEARGGCGDAMFDSFVVVVVVFLAVGVAVMCLCRFPGVADGGGLVAEVGFGLLCSIPAKMDKGFFPMDGVSLNEDPTASGEMILEVGTRDRFITSASSRLLSPSVFRASLDLSLPPRCDRSDPSSTAL
mmetsp:Transcript_29718/g.63165  ORF Transcript_29718/g.63165 Transcript_29718/m.63165 type:complete len:163 (+) Transcript_29718:991-1479(+)